MEENAQDPNNIIYVLLFLILALLATITAVGSFKRTKWGRVFGVVLSAIMLINFPIGTVLGVIGLIAFIKHPKLFGENKLLHTDIKQEYRYRKEYKIQ